VGDGALEEADLRRRKGEEKEKKEEKGKGKEARIGEERTKVRKDWMRQLEPKEGLAKS
jgi:hypothetical protein